MKLNIEFESEEQARELLKQGNILIDSLLARQCITLWKELGYIKYKCPHGSIFGIDFNGEKEECNDCDYKLWKECNEALISIRIDKMLEVNEATVCPHGHIFGEDYDSEEYNRDCRICDKFIDCSEYVG
jgi:hypothetical protein